MSGPMLPGKCEKCAGSLTSDIEELFAFICVNCGKRGPVMIPAEERRIAASHESRMQAEEDRNWVRFWRRRRLSQGGVA